MRATNDGTGPGTAWRRAVRTLLCAGLLAFAGVAAAAPATRPDETTRPDGDPATPAGAAAGPTDAGPAATVEPSATYPVRVWNRTVATLSADFNGASPATRARNAGERLEAWLRQDDAPGPVATTVRYGDRDAAIVTAGQTVLFGLLPEDVGLGEDIDDAAVIAAAERAVAELQAVRSERRSASDPAQLAQAIGLAALLTAIAVGLRVLGSRVYRRVRDRLHERAAVRADVLRKGGYDVRPILYGVLERLAGAIWLVVTLAIVYLWLGFTLKLFPYTRPWGETLGGYVRDAAAGLGKGFVEEIPSLLTLALIWLIARAVSRVVRDWFEAIRVGVIQVDWCDPTAATVSARLAQFAVWIFALTIAYPYIPGAETPAFKGLSVLLGLMVSIGSAGVIGQIVSGIVAVYTKAIRIGDMVKVGEIEGTVTSMGVLSLKIANRLNEEFTIPNAMLASGAVQNMTRLSGERGLILQTSVTIGYDTPWRQIHAMLLLAAARTPEVLRDPAPRVLQKALSDFYVEYTLLAAVAVPQTKPFVLSALHANIQDAFNEYGVQIMSPNFEAQPDHKVWVPKERWHEAPAAAVDAPAQVDTRALGGGD